MYKPQQLREWIGLSELEKVVWLNEARDRFFYDDKEYFSQPERTIEIDGLDIEGELDFYCAIGEAVNGPGGYFGACFHSFDDCLFGGFGLDFPYKINWKNAGHSKKFLNREALEKWEVKGTKGKDDWRNEVKLSWAENAEDLFGVLVDAIISVENRNGGNTKLIIEIP